MNLLTRARSTKIPRARNTSLPTPEELALCQAYIQHTVSLSQVASALELTNAAAHSWIKTKLLSACRNNLAQLIVH